MCEERAECPPRVDGIFIPTADIKRFAVALTAGRPSIKIKLSNDYDELQNLLATHCEMLVEPKGGE